MAYQQLLDQLASLKPVLESGHKSIEVVSNDAPKIVFRLTGFCGGCGCTESYMDGLRDLVAEHCPEFLEVEFVEV